MKIKFKKLKNKIILVINALIIFGCFSNCLACADILNMFLTTEELNETVKNDLLAVNIAFQDLDIILTKKDLNQSISSIDNLIEKYYNFFVKYYQIPPIQFADDPKWRDKLNEANFRIKVVRDLINQSKLTEAHEQRKIAYDAFSALYMDKTPMQEQDVLKMILTRTKNMKDGIKIFTQTGSDEISIHANNIKILAERLLKFETPSAEYNELKRKLVDHLTQKSDIFIKSPLSDTLSCELRMKEFNLLEESIENFLKRRTQILNVEWFDK